MGAGTRPLCRGMSAAAHKHLKNARAAWPGRGGHTTARRTSSTPSRPPGTSCWAAPSPDTTRSPGCWPAAAARPRHRPALSGLWSASAVARGAHPLSSRPTTALAGPRVSTLAVRTAKLVCARLGVPAGMHETSSPRRADQELRAAVGQGVPVIAWADQQLLGYRHLPAWLEGFGGPPVTVYGVDERAGVALVDDRNRAPLTVPLDARRGQPGSGPTSTGSWSSTPGRRAGTPTGSARRSARASGRAGRAPRPALDSFALPAFRRARLLTGSGNAKTWPTVFADRAGLFDARLSVYENLEPVGWRRQPARAVRRVPRRGGRAARHLGPCLGRRPMGGGRPRHEVAEAPCPPAANRSPRPAASSASPGPGRAGTPPRRRRPPPPPPCGFARPVAAQFRATTPTSTPC
jgi:hypothetical protein